MEEIEDALIKALEIVSKEGQCPDKIFHPDYGWIVWDGKGTDAGAEFYKDLCLKKDVPG
jgi:hypothetical protein